MNHGVQAETNRHFIRRFMLRMLTSQPPCHQEYGAFARKMTGEVISSPEYS